MISIGLIIENNTNYEYVINMVMAQVHDQIEVICSFDATLETSAYDILECIGMHQSENVRRIHAIRRRSKTYEEHIKNIVSISRGDYMFIHSSKDWLYDVNVVNLLSENINKDEDLIAGSCILYKDGQYIGETHFSKDDGKKREGSLSIANAIENGLPLLINKKYLQEKCDINSDLDLNSVKMKVVSVPSLCHESESKIESSNENTIENNTEELNGIKGLLTRVFGKKETTENIEKIRVAFVVQMLEVWDKQSPVFEAMEKNVLIDASIIVVPSIDISTWKLNPYHGEMEFLKQRYPDAKLIQAIDSDGTVMKFEAKQYDYVFYQRPYDIYLPRELRAESISLDTKVCYIPYGYQGANVFTEGNTNEEFFRNVYMSFLDSEEIKDVLEHKFRESVKMNEQKFLYLGYPVFDTYLKMKSKKLDKKNKGILWTPRWAFDPEQGGSHFVHYKDNFVGLRDKYPKKNIVIRPHPLMWENVVKEGLMFKKEVDQYKELLQSRNIQIDANKMMEDTIKDTQVLITDFSSIIITYFMTGRPIIYCPFDTQLNELYQKLLPGLYIANSWDEVEKYLEMIENGNDVLFAKRQEIIQKELSGLGGGTSRIVEAIIADYKEG